MKLRKLLENLINLFTFNNTNKLFNRKRVDKIVFTGLIISVFLLVLSPPIKFFNPAIRIEEVLYIILGSYVALYMIINKIKYKVIIADYLFFFLASSTILSIIYGYSNLGIEFEVRDAFEIVKLLIYYFLFRLVMFVEWGNDRVSHLLKALYWSVFFLFIFSMFQYLDIFNFNTNITPLFTKDSHIRVLSYSGRIMGSFSNSNSLGIFSAMSVILGSLGVFRYLINKNKKVLLFSSITLLFSITLLVMSMSRTAMVSVFLSLFGVFSYILISPKSELDIQKTYKVFIVFLVVAISSIGIFVGTKYIKQERGEINIADRFESGIENIQETLDEEKQARNRSEWSFSTRVDNWEYAIKRIEAQPIFGWGPAKSQDYVYEENKPNYIENEYLLYGMRYGLLGLLLYSGLYFFFGIFPAISSKYEISEEFFCIKYMAIGTALLFGLYSIMSGVFYDHQLFPFMIIYSSIVYNITKGEKKDIRS